MNQVAERNETEGKRERKKEGEKERNEIEREREKRGNWKLSCSLSLSLSRSHSHYNLYQSFSWSLLSSDRVTVCYSLPAFYGNESEEREGERE